MIEYRYLNKDDVLLIKEFSKMANHTERLATWIQNCLLLNSKYFLVSAELIDGNINGIVVACSLGFWCNMNETLPVWLGVRTDRLENTQSFVKFMDILSKMITNHFEELNYFQHFIVRKLSKKEVISNQTISKQTSRAWAQGPYTSIVEKKVQTQEDYDKLEIVFKNMIGKFIYPVVILSMNLDNDQRENRIKELNNVRNKIS